MVIIGFTPLEKLISRLKVSSDLNSPVTMLIKALMGLFIDILGLTSNIAYKYNRNGPEWQKYQKFFE